jgi:hypothetical protein
MLRLLKPVHFSEISRAMTRGPSCNFGGSQNPPDSPLCHQFQNYNKLCYMYKSLRNTELDDIKNKLYVQVLIT